MHAYRDQYATLFRLGRGVVLLAISTDPIDALASWAADDEFPFLMGSDEGGSVGEQYGARRSRAVFVVDPEGTITYVARQFRELDPTAYEELGAAIEGIGGPAEPAR
jgi:peroxiredoxin